MPFLPELWPFKLSFFWGHPVLPGVLPNRLKKYTGSYRDLIHNLEILLQLDTLEALLILLFLLTESTPRRLIFCQCTVRIKLVVYQQKRCKKCGMPMLLMLTSNLTFSYRNIIHFSWKFSFLIVIVQKFYWKRIFCDMFRTPDLVKHNWSRQITLVFLLVSCSLVTVYVALVE